MASATVPRRSRLRHARSGFSRWRARTHSRRGTTTSGLTTSCSAVLREHEAVAAGILRDLEVDPEHLHRIVRATLPGPSSWPSTEAQIASPRAEKAATGTGGPRVTIREMQSETFPNARELAQAFGSTVCEPTWWPADTEHISYRLVRGSGPAHYEIGGTRHGAIPICVVGHAGKADLNGRSPRDWLSGEWSAPPELADLRGAIGAVGTPRRLQAVIYSCGLQIQLIGYIRHRAGDHPRSRQPPPDRNHDHTTHDTTPTRSRYTASAAGPKDVR